MPLRNATVLKIQSVTRRATSSANVRKMALTIKQQLLTFNTALSTAKQCKTCHRSVHAKFPQPATYFRDFAPKSRDSLHFVARENDLEPPR